MSAIAILQARMSSTRLPGKVMLAVNGKPMIYWQVQRILQVPQIAKLVVTTSLDPSDDILAEYLAAEGVEVFRGSLDNVHSRYLAVINGYATTDTFLRFTGDCPFTMPSLITAMLSEFSKQKYDYYSNVLNPTYPDGLDIEIFSRDSFLRMSLGNLSDLEREHVTLKFRSLSRDFRIGEKRHSTDLSNMRWTVDHREDFEFVRNVFDKFVGCESTFSIQDVLNLLQSHPELNTQLPGTLRNIALRERETDTV